MVPAGRWRWIRRDPLSARRVGGLAARSRSGARGDRPSWPTDTRIDPLLLRLALAEQATHNPRPLPATSPIWLRQVRGEPAARGNRASPRRSALPRWTLLHRPEDRRLLLARANWEVQREPADARILLASSAGRAKQPASGRPGARLAASTTRVQDERLAALAARLAHASARATQADVGSTNRPACETPVPGGMYCGCSCGWPPSWHTRGCEPRIAPAVPTFTSTVQGRTLAMCNGPSPCATSTMRSVWTRMAMVRSPGANCTSAARRRGRLCARAPATLGRRRQTLHLRTGQQPCRPAQRRCVRGAALLAPLCAATCRARVSVHYALLFDLDPLHRGLLTLSVGGVSHAYALSPARQDATFDVAPGYGETVRSFFATGVDHLLTGIDHMLFVTMLLVPAMFRRRASEYGPDARMLPVTDFRRDVHRVAEGSQRLHPGAWHHAHAIGSAHRIRSPQRVSEAGIALTILVNRARQYIPFHLPARRWPLAFAFGLVHGLGFATALGPMTLPPVALGIALISFNLGLEFGAGDHRRHRAADRLPAAPHISLPAPHLARHFRRRCPRRARLVHRPCRRPGADAVLNPGARLNPTRTAPTPPTYAAAAAPRP